MSKRQVVIGVCVGLAMAAGASYFGPRLTSMVSAEPAKPSECSIIADEKSAERLITRLFKEAKIKGYDKLVLSPGASVCLLEVDLSIAGNTGFMYVLPNGEELLNGPMLDKRSKVEVPTAEQVKQYEELKAAPVTPVANNRVPPAPPLLPLAQTPTKDGTQQDSAQEQNFSPSKPKFNSPADVLDAIKALPALVSERPGTPVYVLLDPLCTHCQSLFKKSAELTEKFGIQWHWVPIFTNTSGHAMAALVMKVAEKDRTAALSLLSEMMSENFDVPKYADQFRALQKSDYERPQKNAITFLDIFKSSAKAAGTPYVAFKIPATGQVEVISGEPLESDLLPLLGGAEQPE